MLNSSYLKLCGVKLPFANRQHYMHACDIENPTMPEGFADYVPIVDDLLRASGVRKGVAYITVDEKIVRPGMSQRRPGPHVDGCFMPEAMRWGSGWNHYCNHVPFERMPVIVAASVSGCKAWAGLFDATPREDGDLSHAELGEGALLPANQAFFLSPDCVHESMIFDKPTRRTFLRLAMPVGSYADAIALATGETR